LRDIVNYSSEDALNFGDLKELRNQYQEYLQGQNEESELNLLSRAIKMSLGIFDFSDNPSKLSDQELEPYLSEKRLDLKKYFVFNLGKEVNIKPKITVSGEDESIRSEPIGNIRLINSLLSKHLTQLFNDGCEKQAIAFAGKHTNHNSLN
jgi:hypothetical protein